MDDVVHQEQDQSPDMLTRLDQCSECAVQDAIPDQRIRATNQYSLGNELEDDRMFWIAKMCPHHHAGRMMRGAVRHFLVENIHPKDRMTDVLTLLGSMFVADCGNTIQFHRKEAFVRIKNTKIIELVEQRVGPNNIKLVYPDPWIVKLKAWVNSYPDQRVFKNVLVKSSCLPYKHHVDGVPQGSKDAPDWATFKPDTKKLPEQDDPPKYHQILDLNESLPSEEANQL
ncbi:hypothetical protein P9112_011322 [Eukaryota sp. TZLM1-RC]